MSPKFRQIAATIFVLLLLAGIGYFVILVVNALLLAIASLDSNISVAIIAAAATVFVSVISIVLGKLYESRAQLQREHRDKKIPVYEDLIKFTFSILMGVKTGNQPTKKEISDFMSDFTQRIIVWGSDDVLAAWVKWRRLVTNQAEAEAKSLEIMLLYEHLILVIRKDLKHKNKGLDTGDILALFVTDIDQHLPMNGNRGATATGEA